MGDPRRTTFSPPPTSHAADELTVPEQLLHERVRSLFSRDFLRSVLTQGRADLQDSKLSPAVVAVLLLTFVIERLPSLLNVLDRARAGLIGGLPALCASRQAFSQRLLAIGHTPFLRLLRETTRRLSSAEHTRPWIAPLAPFARGIYAVDDTTLDALVRRVDWLRVFARGEPQVLAGKLGCVIDLSTGKLAEVLYTSDSAANEKSHIRPLLASFPAGALFVLDLGYFAYPFFDWMTKRAWYFVTRLRQGTSYEVLQVLADRPLYRDRIVYLGAHRADRAARPVRVVELLINGAWWSYLTNVLDPEQLPADAVWRLYQERWTIEIDHPWCTPCDMTFISDRQPEALSRIVPTKAASLNSECTCVERVRDGNDRNVRGSDYAPEVRPPTHRPRRVVRRLRSRSSSAALA